jgi:hypothetical protein
VSTCRQPGRRQKLDLDAGRSVDAGSLDDRACDLVGVEALAVYGEPSRIEPAREAARKQELVDDRREPLRLLGEEIEQEVAPVHVERRVTLAQRHGGAVHRSERRSQLVRDSGDEVRLRPVETLVLGDVAERVHGTVAEAHA